MVGRRHKFLAAAALWGACAWFLSLGVDFLIPNLHNAPHWLLQACRPLFMGISVAIGYVIFANNLISELAHTLDITPDGARLGAIRHPLKIGDKLTLQYRQRKLQFRVVWVKALEGTREYQVGLEAVGNDSWGLDLPESDLRFLASSHGLI
jgi:hypothetical protein